ncbi:hypothetical protein P7K49_028339 [Saguinus oedipus]|uniref:Rho-GAP domain-containing protein n=1 Tax=Saguinus oedipus TaxID=9490 RepID=A0ABQ9UC24_SAGOE|nr:hypothetical protein P7K49_028339 [Saguinus oedipus]
MHSSWEEEDELLKAREGHAQWPGWQGRCFSQGRDGRRPTWDPQGRCSTSMFFPDNRDVSMMLSEMDIHAIADTLMLCFGELPEPLFTDKFYPTWMRASVLLTPVGRKKGFRWLIPHTGALHRVLTGAQCCESEDDDEPGLFRNTCPGCSMSPTQERSPGRCDHEK